MSDASASSSNSHLRRDLNTVIVKGKRRVHRIVIDEVSGRFTRTADHVWQSLIAGTNDAQLWREARAAGWTRTRETTANPRSQSLWCVRIPLGTLDRPATWLAARSGILFATPALVAWSALILFAAIIALSRSGELFISLGDLPTFIAEANPWYMGGLLLITKLLHELAHGVVCRRVGGRVGDIGILLLCGVPCPYCDVTDIWRQPSSLRRASVMFAGIYVELILASLATLVWFASNDTTLRLFMLNIMVICGVSTLVFNANPLMRYDGYFLLADLLGSVNLRQEARNAFASVVTARLAGKDFRYPATSKPRAIALAIYHIASSTYRLLVFLAIATLALGVATRFHLRPLAVILLVTTTLLLITRWIGQMTAVIRGNGDWSHVSRVRRVSLTTASLILGLCILCVPTRRFCHATGWVDSADSTTVYLGSDGVVEQVSVDYGQPVNAGETLVKVRNDSLALEQVKLRGQLNVARLRRDLSRRGSLDRTSTHADWNSLQAAEESFEAQLTSLEQLIRQADVRSPKSGIVLPSSPVRKLNATLRLPDHVGKMVHAHQTWCRISPNGELHAVFQLDARDRAHVSVGSPVRISLMESPANVWHTRVTSISEISDDQQPVTRQATFEALCPLGDAPPKQLIRWLGKECRTLVELPERSLASDIYQWTVDWLGGG